MKEQGAMSRNDDIKARAYRIWEDEGRPNGRHHDHWSQAVQELGDDTGTNLHPGMMGDGTEEQNLGQPGNPGARITADEVEEAFGTKSGS